MTAMLAVTMSSIVVYLKSPRRRREQFLVVKHALKSIVVYLKSTTTTSTTTTTTTISTTTTDIHKKNMEKRENLETNETISYLRFYNKVLLKKSLWLTFLNYSPPDPLTTAPPG